MLLRIQIAMVALLLLSACGKGGISLVPDVSFSMINSYASIERDFKRGRIMRAREGVLKLEKGHEDYARAHKLLEEKIEPARRRIYVHYLRTAKRLEKQRIWDGAMDAYAKAKEVTIKPESMEEKRLEMWFKMRQLRLDRLLRQRRVEDAMWMQNLSAYDPPKGVSSSDEVYLRQRKNYNELLDERADLAYDEAKRYLRNGLSEIAYVEIESHLRLQPNSESGSELLAEIRKELPKQLSITRIDEVSVKKKRVAVKRIPVTRTVTADQIQEAIKGERLMEAKQLLQRYRRNGGKDADKLSAQLQKRIETKAYQLFTRGSLAFKEEKLDEAIGYWSDAVTLMPGQSEYVEALHRARQLKERLKLLQEQKESDPVPPEE